LFIEEIRRQYEAELDHMQTDLFRQQVLAEIDAERNRQATLKHRVDFLGRQVDYLLQDGVRLLKQRLTEV
jgi:hypothetical protein